ncbi:hypothetical protein MNQ98_02590 [Paenibacillus sp. N3/727]|uniref:hypothetical protein n=1 Tax=Paenibacillus sp. N3/727 TaxID=2925845 RepID=UPI001F534377|nr:hypothetical protein [Paenibacillus sp. N3/727]UNK18954.1 hypothetical protein MNQ98_02590 [Paenibacillus sp. N3/727]
MNRGIKLLAAAACALSLMFAFRVPEASALKCAAPPKPVTEEMAYSALTFKGTLVSETSNSSTFRVSTWWKGDSSQATVTLKANMWIYFEPGEEYIVFAGKQNGKLSPNLCGNTALSSDLDVKPLGPGTPVLSPPEVENLALEATTLGAIIVSIMGLIGVIRSRLF